MDLYLSAARGLGTPVLEWKSLSSRCFSAIYESCNFKANLNLTGLNCVIGNDALCPLSFNFFHIINSWRCELHCHLGSLYESYYYSSLPNEPYFWLSECPLHTSLGHLRSFLPDFFLILFHLKVFLQASPVL